MYVIGTAGHVDHGKSSLVEALTGIDPDRWAEEKAREMTIDLGFAWLRFDGLADEIGLVDVPGHIDFIENMLAGIGGIDLALLVVAVDEGVMPQTREHLAILDLLDVRHGVVALTKSDLIDDPEWLELVQLDVAELLAGTTLESAPLVPVSARTGRGLDELRTALSQALAATQPREDRGQARLPIDRVFSLSGFGTIVTGTLTGGSLQPADAVEIQPTGLSARIRGLQSHQTKIGVARPGRRVAVNLTGVNKRDVRRGDVLARPGLIRPTVLCDVQYRHLPGAPRPLKHNSEVKLFVGAAELLARVRVLGQKEVAPGAEAWLQLALRRPAALLRGDRFILRRPSPGTTLGGGLILDPQPGRQHRRFRPEVIERLQTLAQGTPTDLLLQALRRHEPIGAGDLAGRSPLDRAQTESVLTQLLTEGQAILLEEQLVTQAFWSRWQDELIAQLEAYHAAFPLRAGMPREELRSRLRAPVALFNPALAQAAADGLIATSDAVVRRPGHRVVFTPEQQAAIDGLMARLSRDGVQSPAVKECRAVLGDELYAALVDLGQLRPLNNDVVYAAADYERFTGQIVNHLRQKGTITAAEVRDMLQTSRKYAIALLEHLDERRITRRVGDVRELSSRRAI